MDADTRKVGGILMIIASFSGGWFLSRYVNKDAIKIGEKFSAFNRIEEAVSENGNLEISNMETAVEAAVNAYYDNSVDGYFQYTADSLTESRVNTINSSEMLVDNGFQIAANTEGTMTVVSVEKDSYAEQQGLRSGDIITNIDDTDIKEVGFAVGAIKILGKNDTSSELTLVRNGEIIRITYHRKFEKNQYERYEMLENNICYISYADGFNEMNSGVFKEAYAAYGDIAESYIIDIRENGGGVTSVCMDILGLFIGESGKVVEYYNSGKEKVLTSGDAGKCFDKKIVLLVNENTASAAEIFTAAMMQHYDDITVVGTNTFGKGIFQMEQEITDSEKIKYTAGYYTVGDWECYQGVGIAPHAEVGMDPAMIGTDDDVQLQKAIELLS